MSELSDYQFWKPCYKENESSVWYKKNSDKKSLFKTKAVWNIRLSTFKEIFVEAKNDDDRTNCTDFINSHSKMSNTYMWECEKW